MKKLFLLMILSLMSVTVASANSSSCESLTGEEREVCESLGEQASSACAGDEVADGNRRLEESEISVQQQQGDGTVGEGQPQQ